MNCNSGVCENLPTGYRCNCLPDYDGDHCELQHCTDDVTCYNNGICTYVSIHLCLTKSIHFYHANRAMLLFIVHVLVYWQTYIVVIVARPNGCLCTGRWIGDNCRTPLPDVCYDIFCGVEGTCVASGGMAAHCTGHILCSGV